MKNDKGPMRLVTILCLMIVALLAMGALCPPQVLAQDPPRTYWKYLSGSDALPLLFESISGNTNPFDPSHNVQSNATFDATVEIAAYAHTFSLFDRSAVATVLFTMGRLSSNAVVAGNTTIESTNGFGDPMLELNVNVIGPPAQKTIPDMVRYEPGFSVDLVFDLALPIGEYDSSKTLNIGQNRWYGRVGAPIVWQLGPWVPGRRTTLEFVPAVWLFGNNDNFVGKTLSTDPMYQFDAHLTRDLYERAWVSLDVYTLQGGQASIDGVKGSKLNTISPGLTLGYEINDNMNINFTYKSTINDSSPGDMRSDMFMITLVSGWHPIIEGSKRLQNK
jgi:outer membrane putative beta-barrel porin/alpha-amylase